MREHNPSRCPPPQKTCWRLSYLHIGARELLKNCCRPLQSSSRVGDQVPSGFQKTNQQVTSHRTECTGPTPSPRPDLRSRSLGVEDSPQTPDMAGKPAHGRPTRTLLKEETLISPHLSAAASPQPQRQQSSKCLLGEGRLKSCVEALQLLRLLVPL